MWQTFYSPRSACDQQKSDQHGHPSAKQDHRSHLPSCRNHGSKSPAPHVEQNPQGIPWSTWRGPEKSKVTNKTFSKDTSDFLNHGPCWRHRTSKLASLWMPHLSHSLYLTNQAGQSFNDSPNPLRTCRTNTPPAPT